MKSRNNSKINDNKESKKTKIYNKVRTNLLIKIEREIIKNNKDKKRNKMLLNGMPLEEINKKYEHQYEIRFTGPIETGPENRGFQKAYLIINNYTQIEYQLSSRRMSQTSFQIKNYQQILGEDQEQNDNYYSPIGKDKDFIFVPKKQLISYNKFKVEASPSPRMKRRNYHIYSPLKNKENIKKKFGFLFEKSISPVSHIKNLRKYTKKLKKPKKIKIEKKNKNKKYDSHKDIVTINGYENDNINKIIKKSLKSKDISNVKKFRNGKKINKYSKKNSEDSDDNSICSKSKKRQNKHKQSEEKDYGSCLCLVGIKNRQLSNNPNKVKKYESCINLISMKEYPKSRKNSKEKGRNRKSMNFDKEFSKKFSLNFSIHKLSCRMTRKKTRDNSSKLNRSLEKKEERKSIKRFNTTSSNNKLIKKENGTRKSLFSICTNRESLKEDNVDNKMFAVLLNK